MLNAVNEVAVQAFLDRQIGFRMIDRLIHRVMDHVPVQAITSLEELLETDLQARNLAKSLIPS
jgi:1-deoxy-D-xylulose-5-phosphate reductoisomerase